MRSDSRLAAAVLASGDLGARRVSAALEEHGVRVTARLRSVAGVASLSAPDRAAVVLSCERFQNGERDRLAGLRELAPESLPVVVAAGATRSDVREAFKLGARGFVLADAIDQTLAPTVVAVLAGQLVGPPELAGPLAKPTLSPREKQVLAMVVMGFANREMAQKLFLSETTIKSHLSSAYRKLGARSRQEAAALILDADEGLGAGILAISDGSG